MAGIGIVVGTQGAVSFIHLQLEQWRRINGDAHMLIHDDWSEDRARLIELCNHYGAEFMTTDKRYGHYAGDVLALKHGLEWAAANKFDMLFKLSRRFLPLVNFTDCVRDRPCDFLQVRDGNGIHTECYGIAVRSWYKPEVLASIDAYVVKCPPDHPYHDSETVEKACERWELLALGKRTPSNFDWMVGPWGHKQYTSLWHRSDPGDDYLALAQEYGLPYKRNNY